MPHLLCLLLILPLPAGKSTAQRHDDAVELATGGHYAYAAREFDALAGEGYQPHACRIALADCLIAIGKYTVARRGLERDVPQAERSSEWHRALARIQRRLGDYESAVEHGTRALALDAGNSVARYQLGRLFEMLGKEDLARQTYAPFNDLITGAQLPPDSVVLHHAGLGFYRYSVLTRASNLPYRTTHVLQDVLQSACMIVDLTYWPARLAIADLLSEKYQAVEAGEDYVAVLKINPHSHDAHLGLARLALEAWNFEAVEQQVAICLDINPHSADAYTTLAGLRMIERRFEDAITISRQALQINPNHIDALSHLAAAQIRAGRYDDAAATRARVYTINARPARLHFVIGKHLSSGRQFPEGEKELQQAIAFDPTNPAPRNELAMLYMQWGDEDAARKTADEAFALDQFNDRTDNTLDLLEILSGFQKVHTSNFEIHFDEQQDAVVSHYMGHYLESIYEELMEDYELDSLERTIIEIFPDHQQFGVRIHGKPWIHTIGACTGRVIAMDAPREGVSGTYHYANVLRHEFTHTVTLAATRNRIPHWMTEGLAVLQEDRPRRWKWMQLLAQGLRDDALFTLRSIDWGFIRPRRAGDRQMAYAQSEWICEFLIERFGYDIINKMLARFRDGAVQREVFPEFTGMSIDDFDAAFRMWARKQAADWGLPLTATPHPQALAWLGRFYPDHPRVLAARALHALSEERLEDALDHVNRALAVDAQHAEALEAAADVKKWLVHDARSDDEFNARLEEVKGYYEQLAEHHPERPIAHEFLAEWAQRNNDSASAEPAALKLRQLQPRNPASYRILSGIHLARDDDASALPELLELARFDEQDADIPRQVARIYRDRKQLPAAASWYREAIFIDAYDVLTHRNYAEVLTELGRYDQAIEEYRMLTLLEPQAARHLSDLAFLCHRAGKRDQAQEAARKAVELDPATPARQLLD